MSNEIKVGDKVRVREDAPKIYIKAIFPNLVSSNMEVTEIEDECARIKPLISKGAYLTFEFIIPTKYLVKVDAEKKEAKFKCGDKVRMKDGYYKEELHGCIGIIRKIDGCNMYVEIDSTIYPATIHSIEPYTEPTEETLPNVNHSDIDIDAIVARGYIPDPTTFFCNAHKFDWDAYTADLAKEITVKVANRYKNHRLLAFYAVKAAKAVVEGLKRK